MVGRSEKTIVAMVAPLPPIQSGIAQHAAASAAALGAAGCDLILLSWRSQWPSLMFPGSAATIRGLSTHSLSWWNPFSWIVGRSKIANADLIVFPWASPFNAWVLAVLIAGRRRRAVAIVHNVVPHEPMPFNRLLGRFVLSGLRRYVVHSDYVFRQLGELIECSGAVVVPHPANLKVAPRPMSPTPPVRLLFLGHLRPYKGVEDLIDAVPILTSRGVDVRLRIIGEDWGIARELRKRIEAWGIEERIDVQAEYINDNEVDVVLAASHIVVLPYLESSQSGVVPMAHQVGRPVVVTRVGGLAETVREGIDGEIASPGDPASLADAILRALALIGSTVPASRADWAGVAQAILDE